MAQIRYLLVVLTTLTAVHTFCSCKGSEQSRNADTPEETRESLAVKPMDDPDNPYRDAYRAWDQWLYANIDLETDGTLQGIVNKPRAERAEGDHSFDSLCTIVTSEGFLLPLAECVRASREAYSQGRMAEFEGENTWVCGFGQVDTQVFQDWFATSDSIRSEFYPTVPEWLVASPPVWANLLPNGDVITYGALGSGEDSLGHSASHSDHTPIDQSEKGFFRYSNEGELLGQAHGQWWTLYYTSAHPGQELPDGYGEFDKHGVMTFYDPNTDSVLSRWNWDGTEILPGSNLPDNNCHCFQMLPPGSLSRIHSTQS